MDQPKVERMLRLMKLMSGSVDYSVDELAAKLDTSYRSIYRYIDSFRSSGFAVEKVGSNVYKIVSMPADYPDFSKLVCFSEEEAYIVNGLIDRLDPTNMLKSNLKAKLATIYRSTSIADYVDSRSSAANVQSIGRAIEGKRAVVIRDYESGNSHTVRDRRVEPFAFTTNYIDVWAYDLEDGRCKLFKIARMGEVEILDQGWRHEKQHVKDSTDIFRTSGKTPLPIRLRLSVKAKSLLVEEFPLAEADLSKDGDSWILATQLYNYAGACRFFVGLADEIEILESDEFRAYVAAYLSRIKL